MDTKNGNAIELIEGSPATVNMTASANPTPIEYEWAKESPALELEKLHSDPTDETCKELIFCEYNMPELRDQREK